MSQQINLFNPIFLKQKKYFSAIAMAKALGLILLGAGCIFAYSGYRFSSVQQDETNTSAQLIAVEAELSKVDAAFAPHAKNQALADNVVKTELEVKSLQDVFDTLKKGDIGNTEGYSSYMIAFSRQIVDGLWLTGFTIIGAGNEMDLRGRALRPELVPSYISRLKNETIMQGKTFSTLEMHLPQAAAASSEHQTDAPVLAPYVEFELRSSGIENEKTPSAAPTMRTPQALPSLPPLAKPPAATTLGTPSSSNSETARPLRQAATLDGAKRQ
ncbi:PilN domain-containing protein [Glaciimonas sp. PAMC28666]|uniref:PilN domain-containing protein n=1 Tax=Glaciimonas sp. PAMC28666 TaxID=2807626 RepID=UPI001962A560|nr:PilN domain-containing protein [Glaciimonas sp. PAMC28666]QRX82832.1 PilN domain-containing protein [Glaciimonas sp. PAMC28666]